MHKQDWALNKRHVLYILEIIGYQSAHQVANLVLGHPLNGSEGGDQK